MNYKSSLSGKIYPLLCGLNFFLLSYCSYGRLENDLIYLAIFFSIAVSAYYYFIQNYSELFDHYKWHLLFICIAISILLLLFVKLNLANLVLAMIIFFGYHFPANNLRNIPYLKNACVAICWTLLTSTLNLFANTFSENIVIFSSNFLIVFSLSLLNDKIDAPLDYKSAHRNVYNMRSFKFLYNSILITSIGIYTLLMIIVLKPDLFWFNLGLIIMLIASFIHFDAKNKSESFWLKIFIDLALIFHCLSLLYK